MTETRNAGAVITVGFQFTPGLEQAQVAIQDADAALLGVKVIPASQGSVSAAMQHHRDASKRLFAFLWGGAR